MLRWYCSSCFNMVFCFLYMLHSSCVVFFILIFLSLELFFVLDKRILDVTICFFFLYYSFSSSYRHQTDIFISFFFYLHSSLVIFFFFYFSHFPSLLFISLVFFFYTPPSSFSLPPFLYVHDVFFSWIVKKLA